MYERLCKYRNELHGNHISVFGLGRGDKVAFNEGHILLHRIKIDAFSVLPMILWETSQNSRRLKNPLNKNYHLGIANYFC